MLNEKNFSVINLLETAEDQRQQSPASDMCCLPTRGIISNYLQILLMDIHKSTVVHSLLLATSC